MTRRRRTSKKKIPDPVEIPLPAGLIRGVHMEHDCRAFRMGECSIFVGTIREEDNHDFVGWHISISHPSRYPTWDEVAYARYQLVPDNVVMAMILPPRSEYINIDANCFQLHQVERKKRLRGVRDASGRFLGFEERG